MYYPLSNHPPAKPEAFPSRGPSKGPSPRRKRRKRHMLNVIALCHSCVNRSGFSPRAVGAASAPPDGLLLWRLHTAGAVKLILSRRQSRGVCHLTNPPSRPDVLDSSPPRVITGVVKVQSRCVAQVNRELSSRVRFCCPEEEISKRNSERAFMWGLIYRTAPSNHKKKR